MTADSGRAGGQGPLIVGDKRWRAARVFASEFESCTVLSYSELDDAHLAAASGFVGVAAGDDMLPVVRSVLAAALDRELTVAVEMPSDPAGGRELKAVVVEVGVPLAEVRRINGRTCLVFTPGAPSDHDAPWVLDALFVAAGPTPALPTGRPEQVAEQWRATAAQVRADELQLQVETMQETDKQLRESVDRLRRELRQARRPGTSTRPTAKRGEPAAPPPRVGLARRVLGAVSGQGAPRLRIRHLALLAGAVLAAVVVLTTVFALVGGRVGGLLGFAAGALLAALTGLGLLLRGQLSRLEASSREAAHGNAKARNRDAKRDRETLRRVRNVQNRSRKLSVAMNDFLGTQPATAKDLELSVDRINKHVQASINLFRLVEVEAVVPAMTVWRAAPDLIAEAVTVLLTERPRVVVETGSGVSTLFLALAAEQHQLDVRIVALEHHRAFAAETRRLLERHGVAHRAEVRWAPLARTSIPGHATPWYDEDQLADLHDVGLVLVDGPPASTGPAARYPLVPLMKDRLAARCTILVDDLIRDQDREVVRLWQEFLTDFVVAELDLIKGAARLHRDNP